MPHIAIDSKVLFDLPQKCLTVRHKEGQMRTVEVRVRLPEDLKAWLVSKARFEGRSANMQAVQALKVAMAADTNSNLLPFIAGNKETA